MAIKLVRKGPCAEQPEHNAKVSPGKTVFFVIWLLKLLTKV